MTTTDWEDPAYQSSYQNVLTALRKRRLEDPDFSRDQVRGILEHLYIQDGLDHYGRGRLQDLKIQATIDAHEAILEAWDEFGTDGP